MKRIILASWLAIAGYGGAGLVAHPVLAATLCVGNNLGCYATIQAALDAAHDGDVIRIDPGTFQGGISITKSVTIIGSGDRDQEGEAGQTGQQQGDDCCTIIRGGSHVLTIGSSLAPSETEPTVSIAGVTITGGDANTSAYCSTYVDKCGPGYPQATALGGGILIPPAAGMGAGATVTIANSVITGNRATPVTTVPSLAATCPGGPCPFALGAGGGIDSWGTLTLSNTTVGFNQAGGGVSSGGVGAGIVDEAGNRMTVVHSVVTDNSASAAAPHGREVVGGGIFVGDGGMLTIADSIISNNSANLVSTLPDSVSGMTANRGGIAGPGSGSVTIDNSRIDGNTVSVTDGNGSPAAYDAGVGVFGAQLVLRNSSVTNNRLVAHVVSTDATGPSGSALEFDGADTVINTQISRNSSVVVASAGTAGAIGAISALNASAQPAHITNSVISDNSMRAVSLDGTATVQGGAIVNNGLLELRGDQISENIGRATGPAGSAQGGGIFNGNLFFTQPVQLTIENASVTRNTLTASPGLTLQGGGLFTVGFPVTLTNSVIANNVPDQCFGC